MFDSDDRFRREEAYYTSSSNNFAVVARGVLMRHRRAVVAFAVAAVIFVLVVLNVAQSSPQAAQNRQRAEERSWYPQQMYYQKYWGTSSAKTYDLSFISDDDKASKRNPDKLAFTSTLQRARLRAVPSTKDPQRVQSYELEIQSALSRDVTTTYNENGRGMELSDLCNYNDKLLAFDDRTGIIFWYNKGVNKMVPYAVLVEGNAIGGDKGQKTEWAFVAPAYDANGRRKPRDALYVGSIGKEWNDPNTGEIVNFNNQWVKIVDIAGSTPDASSAATAGGANYAESFTIEHVNVRDNLFEVMRKKSGALNPGYIVHEAACYNSKYRNWWFLPRRHSTEPYNEQADEHAGTNLAFVVNSSDPFHASAEENERNMDVRRLGVQNNTRGWSSCKFLPYNEDHLLAVRSMEVDGTVAAYATVIDITTGKVLLPETFLGWKKFEGVEIV